MLHNTWVIEQIEELNRRGLIRSVARDGFIRLGKGAIVIEYEEDKEPFFAYFNPEAFQKIDLDPERRKAILDAIATYNPLEQAVVVSSAPLGEKGEIITCLVKF